MRDENADIRGIFSGFQTNYLNIVLANLLVFAIVGIGMVLLVVPGIIFGCRLSFVPYLVMDRGLDPVAAIEKSWNMTRGHGWRIFAMYLVAIVLICVGFMLVIVPAFFAWIYASCAFASLYHAVDLAGEGGVERQRHDLRSLDRLVRFLPLGGRQALAALFFLGGRSPVRSTARPSQSRVRDSQCGQLKRGTLHAAFQLLSHRLRAAHLLLATVARCRRRCALQAQAPSQQVAPAAVPAAVAIPRPTAAELKTAQDSFAKFLASADAATRGVLQKYPGLLEVRARRRRIPRSYRRSRRHSRPSIRRISRSRSRAMPSCC